jgi:Ca2+-binding EF-hand superfamily protein
VEVVERDLKLMLSEFDADKDGYVTREEFGRALERSGRRRSVLLLAMIY